jgi:hypothetical protein
MANQNQELRQDGNDDAEANGIQKHRDRDKG